jgi:hypothetical protein
MRMLWALILAVVVGGCSFAVDGGITAPAPDLPGCDQTDQFAFTGETTMAALGLDDFGGAEANRVGSIWITANKVVMDRGPVPARGVPVAQEPTRMVCVQWKDGSGMAGPIADDWQPPVATSVATGTFPVAPVIVVIMLVTLVGASFLAFRSEHPAGA